MNKTAKENSRPLVHGTEVGYHKGCRCRDCMDIHNALKKAYRRKKALAGLKYT